MKVYQNNIIINTAVAFVILILHSCARPGSITGGPIDTTAPKIVTNKKSSVNYQTNFEDDKIVLFFDEWVQLKSPSTNVIISPFLKNNPKYILRGKQFIIDLSEVELRDSTTYIFNIENAIVDITEGNRLEADPFVFSTGTYIDSLEIKGSVVHFLDKKEASRTTVSLYDKDSIETRVTKENPIYTTLSDSLGNFRFKNLSKGEYTMIAVQNKNATLFYDDATELISLPINLVVNDSNTTAYTLELFDEEDPLQLKEYSCNTQVCEFTFNREVQPDELKIEKLNNYQIDIDKQLVRLFADSTFNGFDLIIDEDTTLIKNFRGLRNVRFVNSKINFEKPKRSYVLAKNDTLVMSFNKLINGVENIELFDPVDSTSKEVEYSISTNRIHIYPNLNEEENNFILRVKNIYHADDSVSYDIQLKLEDKSLFGELQLYIPKKFINYIYSINEIKGKPIKEGILTQNTLSIDKAKPGNYVVELIEDIDSNGKWSRGSLLNNSLPETKIYSDTLKIRSNWTITDTLKVSQ